MYPIDVFPVWSSRFHTEDKNQAKAGRTEMSSQERFKQSTHDFIREEMHEQNNLMDPTTYRPSTFSRSRLVAFALRAFWAGLSVWYKWSREEGGDVMARRLGVIDVE
jgi:hypothetical protein